MSIVINGEEYVKKETFSQITLVRTYSAGVHFGELLSHDKETVVLKNARRLWRWKGANTLNEVAKNGVDNDYTRISEAVESITLTNAIELIPVTEKALKTLGERWPN